MNKYFLIKEHNYEKIDNVFRGRNRCLISTGFDDYNQALEEAKKVECLPDDVIYVVEVVGKLFGYAKIK